MQVAVALYIISKVGKYFSSLGLLYTRESSILHVSAGCAVGQATSRLAPALETPQMLSHVT